MPHHARKLVTLSQILLRQEIRLNVAQEWRELPIWVVHLSIQQISILLGQMQRMYGLRLGEQSEPLKILREAEVMVDNATAMAFGMPANHVPPSVASAIFRATTVLTHSQLAYDQYVQAKELYKKSGSMFGELSKAQREAGLMIPFPATPMPVLMGRRLDSIVGPIVNQSRFSTLSTVEPHRVSRFSPALLPPGTTPSSHALVPMRAAGASDMFRAKAGALYHFVTSDLAARGVNTDRSCIACLYTGRRGPEAAGHSFKGCPNLAQAASAAKSKGFTA